MVDAEQCEAFVGDGRGDGAAAAHLGNVAHSLQQPVGDARRASRPRRHLVRAAGVDVDREDGGRPVHDLLEVVDRVVVDPPHIAEAIAERAGDQAGAGGGANQRERRQAEANRAGRRALAQHEVELEVLHGRIEDLLHGPAQAVDLVDEQHVTLVQIGEDGGQVAGPYERRPRRDAQVDAHLGGDDGRERGLAGAGWAGEQQVVGRLLAAARRFQQDRQSLAQLGLAHELVEPPRAERDLLGRLDRIGGGRG